MRLREIVFVKPKLGADAIALWISLRLPSCRPGFKSQAYFIQFVIFELSCEKDENKKRKEAGNCPHFIKTNQKYTNKIYSYVGPFLDFFPISKRDNLSFFLFPIFQLDVFQPIIKARLFLGNRFSKIGGEKKLWVVLKMALATGSKCKTVGPIWRATKFIHKIHKSSVWSKQKRKHVWAIPLDCTF